MSEREPLVFPLAINAAHAILNRWEIGTGPSSPSELHDWTTATMEDIARMLLPFFCEARDQTTSKAAEPELLEAAKAVQAYCERHNLLQGLREERLLDEAITKATIVK